MCLSFVILLQDAFTRSKKLSDGKTYVSGQVNAHRVFTDEQEKSICEYAIRIAKMFYGLTILEFCKLAYSYAEACKSSCIPGSWVKDGAAPRDWYYGFMSRHPNLTLKTPEGMSIKRAMSFNRTNVEVFFNAYSEALTLHDFTPDRIFNMDESGLSTVMKPLKVVCERGTPVASQVSQERGCHMTFVGIVNAAGQCFPPVFIIARKKMNVEFMRGTMDGSKGLAVHNGWMNGELFLETLKHIREKSYCSLSNKILLIMDNAGCHMNIHAVEYAMQNGIVIVTLPPHTTAKLQPLDVSVFGPFKACLRAIQNDFRISNPNKAITEYMLPELASKAWLKACSPTNVLNGFAATGIWPLNRNIFPDDAFLGAEVSERDLPPNTDEEEQAFGHNLEISDPVPEQLEERTVTPLPTSSPVAPVPLSDPETAASSSSTPATPGPSTPATPGPVLASPVTPEDVRPYPKGRSLTKKKGPPTIKACILTSDPKALKHLREKEEKRLKKEARKMTKGKGPGKKKGTKEPQKKKRCPEKSDSSEEESVEPVTMDDSSEYSEEEFVQVEETRETYPFLQKDVEVRDFLKIAYSLSIA